MILSRVIEHVKAQNWTAVALDFVIVVAGVFVGMQVTNWNAARADRLEYKQALLRYREELKTNLTILDTVAAASNEQLGDVRRAFDALLSCRDSPENRALVESGIMRLGSTTGLQLRDRALRELNESQRLLAQESQFERKLFADTRYKMDVFREEARFLEDAPLTERIENNSILAVGPIITKQSFAGDVHYSERQRSLKLAAPIDVACKNNQLVKSFYTWERWQNVLPSDIGILHAELESSLKRLDQ